MSKWISLERDDNGDRHWPPPETECLGLHRDGRVIRGEIRMGLYEPYFMAHAAYNRNYRTMNSLVITHWAAMPVMRENATTITNEGA